ncbi:MAG: hypothetical protein PHV05_12330 [Candidatus Riflebacteria bacterium]|nr:hypothetical protein [Candidatus Riflebacteria bacterium]
MRKNTLRVLSSVMCLIFLASLFQAPLMAAVSAIPVKVGNQTINVTPGQWVSVRSGTQITHYNVRFIDGKPVALEMSQYTKLVFGDAGAAASAGSVADDVAQASSGSSSSSAKSSGSSSSSSSSSNGSAGNSAAGASAGSVADDVAQSQGSAAQTGSSNSNSSQSSSSQSSSSAAGSAADDVAQAGTSASSGSQGSSPVSSSVADDVAAGSAGSVADDIAQGTSAGKTTNTTTETSTTSTKTTKTTWDPAKHPRDPQTGRFISQKEAIERGLMDPPAGSTADDVAQGGAAAGSTADDVAQGGAAGSVADDGAAAQAGTSGKATIGSKFKSGYQAGKAMTNQGVQNVKDSLKSGFSAKNLLVTAGITVGVDLATQIMRGEKPSVKKALKTVCSAEFVGGVGGAVLGAAAGSFFVPFLSAVPVVGGVLSALAPSFGSIIGSSVGAYVAGDLKNGKFSIREAFKSIDWVSVTGQAIGSTAGAALGSFLGPVGTVVGGMVGGYLGNWAAKKIAGLFRKDKSANMPELAMPTGTGTPVGGGAVVTIGGDEAVVSDAAPAVSGDDTVVIGGDGVVIGDYESEVALAYSKYQELYKLYNDMLTQGRQEDALTVAASMNEAKKEYDTLRAKGSK